MASEEIRDFVVLGLDIDGYSERSIQTQNMAQTKVDRLFCEAFRKHMGANKAPKWIDTGDGGYALFDWSPTDVLLVIRSFSEALGRDNDDAREDRRISVRIALHYGQVICWTAELGAKYTSSVINECCRLLDAMGRNRGGQVVCSGTFRDQINVLSKVAESTRLRDVTDKHGNFHQLYNLRQEPGFGVRPFEQELHENPQVR